MVSISPSRGMVKPKVYALPLGRRDRDIVPLTAGQAGRTLGGGGWVKRRWIVVLVVMGVVAGACAGDSGSAPSTEATPPTIGSTATTSEVVESTSTFPPDTSTTGIDGEWPPIEVLVANDDGVFLVDTQGETRQLVKGKVADAVDDTRGGLLFQVERGRSSGWWGDGSPIKDTRVWWVQKGSSEVTELLVPTPGMPLDLSMIDTASINEHVYVVYVRHDSTMDPEYGPHGWYDALRAFDIESLGVTEVFRFPAYEHSYGFSVGGGIVLVDEEDVSGRRCYFSDMALPGAPSVVDLFSRDRIVEDLSRWVLPELEPCDTDEECQWRCALSTDASALAFLTGSLPFSEGTASLQVINTQTGAVVFEGEVPSTGWVDLQGSWLLVNSGNEKVPYGDVADLLKLDSGDSRSVPLNGFARFVSQRVAIEAPVVPPTPAAIQLRTDGLGVVDFAMPAAHAVEALVSVMGSAPVDGWSSAAWVDYVGWHEYGLYLGFSTPQWPGWDGMSRLVGWEYALAWSQGWEDLPTRFETRDGVTIGTTVADLRRSYGESLRLPGRDHRHPRWSADR